MAAISQTTLSKAFSWMKMLQLRLKFHCSKGPINSIPALVETMAWRRPGDKPLSEAMMVSLLTHICVTRPQRIKSKRLATSFWRNNDAIITLCVHWVVSSHWWCLAVDLVQRYNENSYYYARGNMRHWLHRKVVVFTTSGATIGENLLKMTF